MYFRLLIRHHLWSFRLLPHRPLSFHLHRKMFPLGLAHNLARQPRNRTQNQLHLRWTELYSNWEPALAPWIRWLDETDLCNNSAVRICQFFFWRYLNDFTYTLVNLKQKLRLWLNHSENINFVIDSKGLCFKISARANVEIIFASFSQTRGHEGVPKSHTFFTSYSKTKARDLKGIKKHLI